MKLADLLHRNYDGSKSPFKPSVPIGPVRPISPMPPPPTDPLPPETARNLLLQATTFRPDDVHAEYDLLTDGEKKDLDFFRRHGVPHHEHEAKAHLDEYMRTQDVDHLDRAIALLLHLRETKHADDV